MEESWVLFETKDICRVACAIKRAHCMSLLSYRIIFAYLFYVEVAVYYHIKTQKGRKA